MNTWRLQSGLLRENCVFISDWQTNDVISEHALTKGMALLQVQSSSVGQEIKSSPRPLWQHDDGDGADFSQGRINERKEEPRLPGVHYQIGTKIGFTDCRLEDKRSRSLKSLHRWPHQPTHQSDVARLWEWCSNHSWSTKSSVFILNQSLGVYVVLLCLISETSHQAEVLDLSRSWQGSFQYGGDETVCEGAKTLVRCQIGSRLPTGFPQHWFVRWFWLHYNIKYKCISCNKACGVSGHHFGFTGSQLLSKRPSFLKLHPYDWYMIKCIFCH